MPHEKVGVEDPSCDGGRSAHRNQGIGEYDAETNADGNHGALTEEKSNKIFVLETIGVKLHFCAKTYKL